MKHTIYIPTNIYDGNIEARYFKEKDSDPFWLKPIPLSELEGEIENVLESFKSSQEDIGESSFEDITQAIINYLKQLR